MRYNITPGRTQARSFLRRAKFRRVVEQMAVDIRKYFVRILSAVDGQEFVPAELPGID